MKQKCKHPIFGPRTDGKYAWKGWAFECRVCGVKLRRGEVPADARWDGSMPPEKTRRGKPDPQGDNS